MRILFVAYPLQPVSAASCGGAEQVLWTLERELNRRGISTAVAACEGSEVSGELIRTGTASSPTDGFSDREVWHRERVLQTVRARQFDLIHDHSGHMWPHVGELRTPLLATLHLPRSFYDAQAFAAPAQNVFFNCVSESQLRTFTDLSQMVGVVRNGIALDQFPLAEEKSGYLLWLGRICPEKAPHIAIDAARAAGVPLIVVGQVYPFTYHQQYFEREIKPRLAGGGVTFLDTPSFAVKLRLLQHARAVLITSLAPETSSMVALEAQACGTPVVARRIGALPEVIVNGLTGLLVDSDEEFTSAIDSVGQIDASACRSHVEFKFGASKMADGYERIYSEIIRRSAHPSKAA